MGWAEWIAAAAVFVAVIGTGIAVQARRAANRSADAAEQSARESKRANDLTVLYKDPYWTIIEEPEPMNQDAGGPVVELRLINQGESPGRDVTVEFDFDPTHLHVEAVSWPFIDRGAHETIPTRFHIQEGLVTSPWNSQVVDEPSRNQVTVKWTSPAGERKSQRVKLPRSDRFIEPKPDSQPA
ncbi:MAG: hypothetical protein J0I04_02425 [Paenarthrobacter ureafaciens]|uniref:hypothetical protein n=1 Tax=Paenarthrobacter ureafaciens TaxID=37931 RepID=UPI001ACF9305|nr:hypothetical protein [Paenarthrobacter ureafaciens]MBN9128494.1 hypothetical protein [Paenarthrobacter ureafaciens]